MFINSMFVCSLCHIESCQSQEEGISFCSVKAQISLCSKKESHFSVSTRVGVAIQRSQPVTNEVKEEFLGDNPGQGFSRIALIMTSLARGVIAVNADEEGQCSTDHAFSVNLNPTV